MNAALCDFAELMIHNDVVQDGQSDVRREAVAFLLGCDGDDLDVQKAWLESRFPDFTIRSVDHGWDVSVVAKHPEIVVRLNKADNNPFYALAKVTRALIEAGFQDDADSFASRTVHGDYATVVKRARSEVFVVVNS